MRVRALALTLAAFALLGLAAPARADITAFIGTNTTPNARRAVGVAAGISLVIVGFEFEYSATSENTEPGNLAPTLKTGMGNIFFQTPTAIAGFQPYFTVGAGVYRETLNDNSHTGFGGNTGGGVKIPVAGPLQLRLDYRVFKQGSDALYGTAHRFYAGANLKF